jgi:nitroreductase
MMPLRDVLELARWAPSGDNTQPWRFAIVADDRVVVYAHDTRDTCVYDLDGHPSQISVGALLETMALAATRFGLVAHVARRGGAPDTHPVFDVRFRDEGRAEDPLVAHIAERRVQRRPMSRRALSAAQKSALEAAVAPSHGLAWFEGRRRAGVARLAFASAKIRLTIPEAYPVHRDVIQWDARESVDRVPSAALGASPASLRLMRWALASWRRVELLNRFAAGTVMPRVELDLVPGLACAAHVTLVAQSAPRTLDDYVAAGRALQRLWLTATALGLQFQPEYTPLVFARYAREGVRFTGRAAALRRASRVRSALDRLLGADMAPRAVFMGRIGIGPPASARSLRLPLDRLLVEPRAGDHTSAESTVSSSSA